MKWLARHARKWCLIGLLTWPMIGQTTGCSGVTNDDREAAAAAITTAFSTLASLVISQQVNTLLGIQASPFSSLLRGL